MLESTKRQNAKNAAWLLLLAVLAEAVILTDSLAAWLGSQISGNFVIVYAAGMLLNYLFWGVGIFFIVRLYRKKQALHFSHTETPDKKHLLLGLLLLVAAVAISFISWGGFKVVKELTGSIKNGGAGLGIAYFVAQYLYYFLEAVLMTMLLALAQEAGERFWGKSGIPYGGIALALLWGLVHILFHGAADGLITTFNALLYGFAFLCMKKNIKYAFPLVFLMFVL